MTEITIRKNCELWKAKGQIRKWCSDNKDALKAVAVIVFCIWVVITLLMWGFTQKTVTIQQCSNVTDPSFEYRIDFTTTATACISNHWSYYDPPCETNYVCGNVSHQEYYTLVEILGQQWGIVTGFVTGAISWVISHPVV